MTLNNNVGPDQYYGINQQAIINGNFSVNGRAVSGAVTLAAGVYGHDRWKAGASGCSYTFATSNGVTTITISAGSLIQTVEGANLFSGTYVLSWTGTAQGKIGGGSFSASGITASLTGGSNFDVEFGTGTVSRVRVNAGSTPYAFQPRDLNEEISKCMRYNKRLANAALTNNIFGGGFCTLTTRAKILIPLTPQMRAVPTLTTNGNFALNIAGTNIATTAIAIDALESNVDLLVLFVDVASGLTAGQGANLVANGDATSYLNFSAEL